jgi:hypothetical protein
MDKKGPELAISCTTDASQFGQILPTNSLKAMMLSQQRDETMSIEALNPSTSNDLAAGYSLLMLSQETKIREQGGPTLTQGNQRPSLSMALPPRHTGPLHRQPCTVEEDENQLLCRGTTGSLPRQQHAVAELEMISPPSVIRPIETPLGSPPRVCSPGPYEVVSTHNSDKRCLPRWFQESTTTVVIGKGHLPRKTAGNILLRRMVQDRLRDYQERNRWGRAIIVSDIYHRLTCLNPEGQCFGNFDPMGNWVEAQGHSARDKIAATFRDCLSHLYKSSTQNKVAKRRTRNVEKRTVRVAELEMISPPSSIIRPIETPLGSRPRVCSPGPFEVVSTHNSDKRCLPRWFQESSTTVVIGKGHLPRKTAGNILLRRMVQDRLRDYQERNRWGRAIIVSDIYHRLTCLNPKGQCFGNFDPMGNWLEAQEHSARDKIAATFRDCLSHLYKSSTQNKVAKRRTRNVEKRTS